MGGVRKGLGKPPGTGQHGKTSASAKRARGAENTPENTGARRAESIFIYRVLEVAHGLMYRSLDQLLGTELVVSSAASAEQEVVNALGEYLNRSQLPADWLPLGTGTHRAYGFLDLALPARRELAIGGALGGIALLEALGFLSRHESSSFLCPHDFEVLVTDLRKSQAWLRLLAQDDGWQHSAQQWWHEGGGTAPAAYRPVFPLRFRILDAVIANSPYVWRWKHFYW